MIFTLNQLGNMATRHAKSNDAVSASLIESILTSDAFMKKISQVISEAVETKLEALVSRYEEKLLQKSQEIDELKLQLAERTDELEQYQRRNCLRIFGEAERDGEDTDCIAISVAKKIGVQLELSDIDRSHRVGRKTNGGTRPIIVKFTSYRKRREMFESKRKLKKTGVTIREDLTRMRLEVLRKAVESFGQHNVWTTDGVVIVKVRNTKFRVKNLAELEKIDQPGAK